MIPDISTFKVRQMGRSVASTDTDVSKVRIAHYLGNFPYEHGENLRRIV